MSATVTSPASGPGPSTTIKYTRVRSVTFVRVLRSEWIKLWSLRSTWWTLGATAVLMVGSALAFALLMQLLQNQMESASPEDQAAMGGVLGGPSIVASGYPMAALVVAVLGALVITGEYGTGMIRSTFAATPRRLVAFFAKATVLAAVTVALTAVSLALSWLVTYPILNANDMAVDFGDGSQVRSLFGTVLYVTLVALFALGVGALLRHTAGAIFTMVALFFVIPGVVAIAVAFASQVEWVGVVNKLLPSVAGDQITPNAGGFADVLDPWVGVGVLAGYTALVLAGAALRLKLQDA